ncbi:MAG TPA: hypothetical protein VGO52_17285 [Hyphomonadaceae bacterium]|jgi:hypothetical protein|nr:hypothetical protein [Hyphomonadaceae bacterium]
MTFRPLFFAAFALAAACVSPASPNLALQETVSLSVSLTQHEDGVDIAEAAASLDEKVAAAPNDPYVLKVAATARTGLANAAQDRALRVKLRQEALAQYDRAIANTRPDARPRAVMMNGQQNEITLSDLSDLRAALFATIQTDRG